MLPVSSWIVIYDYYYNRGLKSYVINSLSNIIISLIIAISPVFLFRCIDVSKISTATKISDVILPLSEGWKRSNLFIHLCVISFMLFVLIQILQFGYVVSQFIPVRKYFIEALGIQEKDLYVLDWIEVIDHIAQKDSSVRISSLEIAQEVLRIDNYLSAFVTDPSLLTWKLPYMNRPCHFPMTLFFFYLFRVSLIGTVLSADGESIVNEMQSVGIQQTKETLSKRFKLIGVILFLISPFYLAFQVFYSIFNYFQAIKSSPGSLSTRNWSLEARWTIREYNELLHVFNQRIMKSYYFSNQYIEQFPASMFEPVYKLICFLCGSFISFLVIVSIFSDISVITNSIIGEKSAFWLIALLAAIYNIFNSLIKRPKISKDPVELYEDIRKYIHYDFTDERNNPMSWETQNRFAEFFQPMWMIILVELCGCLINPIVFLFVLPQHAAEIVNFVHQNSVRTEHVGWICRFSNFEEITNGGNINQNGKIKRSISNFKLYGQNSLEQSTNLLEFDDEVFQAPIYSNQPVVSVVDSPTFTDVRSMMPPSSPRFN